MRLQINGEAQSIASVTTVAELLMALGETGGLTAEDATAGSAKAESATAARKIAVELNGEIVPRSAYAARGIKDGDSVEIVQAVGGG